jgi:hypothetical protein
VIILGGLVCHGLIVTHNRRDAKEEKKDRSKTIGKSFKIFIRRFQLGWFRLQEKKKEFAGNIASVFCGSFELMSGVRPHKLGAPEHNEVHSGRDLE